MATEHLLKTTECYWNAIYHGSKTFEVRRDDRGFQREDILILQCVDGKTGKYITDGFGSARIKEIRKRVSHILTGGQFGIESGFVVMGLKNE